RRDTGSPFITAQGLQHGRLYLWGRPNPPLRRLEMRTVVVSLSLSLAMLYAASAPADKLTYPAATRAATVDDYHGVKVPAPYGWMEDINSPEVAKWVEAENQ